LTIRDERTGDEHEVDQIITAAFANHPHSDHREGWIVKRLRAGNALTLSLVADENGQVASHLAFSSVIYGLANTHGLSKSVSP
jgi:putative acetyltransferase